MLSDSSVDTKFPYQLLLIDRTVSKFCKAFAIDQKKKKSYQNLTVWSIVQSIGFLGRLFGQFLKAELSLNEKCT